MGRARYCGRRILAGLGMLLGVLVFLTQGAAGQSPARHQQGPEVRRLGLSKVGENTLVTLVLDRRAEPKISTRTVAGKPQLVLDFPQSRAGRLPNRLEGDDILVEQVVTEKGSSQGGGVRIVLELYPEQPYAFWRTTQPGPGGQSIFILGLKPDAASRRTVTQQTAPPPGDEASGAEPPWKRHLGTEPDVLKKGDTESAYAPPPRPESEILEERRTEPSAGDYRAQEPRGSAGPASFAELKRLMPQAGALLQGLETEGWTIADSHIYDRPGQRFSRDFTLSNRRYPELAVKIAYLQANSPNTPNISIISLCTDNTSSEAATRYRELRQWNFAKIKQKYEDIGDFFDDALKPLRVKLRQETQVLALRNPQVFENFVRRACPDPRVGQEVMRHLREKVNSRFEGVQYTVSEKPLVLLNLVDFLYVKVYYVDSR